VFADVAHPVACDRVAGYKPDRAWSFPADDPHVQESGAIVSARPICWEGTQLPVICFQAEHGACERSQYTRKHFAKLSGSSSHPPRVLRNTCKLPFPQSPPQTREIATKALV
jgi:hypothetical protein